MCIIGRRPGQIVMRLGNLLCATLRVPSRSRPQSAARCRQVPLGVRDSPERRVRIVHSGRKPSRAPGPTSLARHSPGARRPAGRRGYLRQRSASDNAGRTRRLHATNLRQRDARHRTRRLPLLAFDRLSAQHHRARLPPVDGRVRRLYARRRGSGLCDVRYPTGGTHV